MANSVPRPGGKWEEAKATSSSPCSTDTQLTILETPRLGRTPGLHEAHAHSLVASPYTHLCSCDEPLCPGHRWLWTKALDSESSSEPRQVGSHMDGRDSSSFFLSGSYWAWQPWFQSQRWRPTSDKHNGVDHLRSGLCWDITATGDPQPAQLWLSQDTTG